MFLWTLFLPLAGFTEYFLEFSLFFLSRRAAEKLIAANSIMYAISLCAVNDVNSAVGMASENDDAVEFAAGSFNGDCVCVIITELESFADGSIVSVKLCSLAKSPFDASIDAPNVAFAASPGISKCTDTLFSAPAFITFHRQGECGTTEVFAS